MHLIIKMPQNPPKVDLAFFEVESLEKMIKFLHFYFCCFKNSIFHANFGFNLESKIIINDIIFLSPHKKSACKLLKMSLFASISPLKVPEIGKS